MSPLGFLAGLLLSAFLTTVQILSRHKVKRPKPEDFAVPKAREGALVDQGYGTFATAGNVVWTGDVTVEEFPEGGSYYRANMIIRYAVGPLSRLIDLQFADRSLALEPLTKAQSSGGTATGTSVPQLPVDLTGDGPLTLQVHARQMFGGKLQEGGPEGEIRIYRGTLNQPVDALTIRQFNQVPGFEDSGLGTGRPGLAYICFGTADSPFLFGTTAQPKNIVAIWQYFPHALLDLDLDPLYTSAEIGNNCNPAELVYEVKRDELRGLGQAAAEFDLDSFVAAAARYQAEGLGLSYPGSSSVPARDIIQDICTVTDSRLFEDLSTGKWTLIAMRPEDREGPVVAVTPSTVIKGSLRITRPDWSGTKTEAVLTFRRFDVSPGTAITDELLTPNLIFYVTKIANALQLKGRDVSEVHLFGDDGTGPVEIDASAYSVDAVSGLVRILTWGLASLGTGFQQHTKVTGNYLSGPFMGYRDASVRKEDDANRQRLGRPERLEIDSTYITTDLVAAWVCARGLHKASRRLARAQFKVDRSGYTLRPGSPVDVTDERTGTVIPMRVGELDLGLLEQGEIGIDAIADVFGADVAPAFPPGPNTTPGSLRVAPAMAALYCSGADTLTLQASDPAFSIELQRADATGGTGAETVAESPLAGTTATYVDATTGKTHRGRQVRDGSLPGPWTPWVSVCTVGDADCVLPGIVDSPLVDGLVGTLVIDLDDPQLRVQSIEFQITTADGVMGAWTTVAGPSRYTSPTVALVAGFTAHISRRVSYYDCDATLQTAEATYPFVVAVEPPVGPPAGLVSVPDDLAIVTANAPLNLLDIPSERTPAKAGRATSKKYPFDQASGIRVFAVIEVAGPVGSYLAFDGEAPDAPCVFVPMSDDEVGPVLYVDEASLDLLDPGGAALDPKRWVVTGASVPVRPELKADVRAQLMVGGGDDATGEIYASQVSLQIVSGPDATPDPEPHPVPPDVPGSCDMPADLDDFSYADLAAFDAAWADD